VLAWLKPPFQVAGMLSQGISGENRGQPKIHRDRLTGRRRPAHRRCHRHSHVSTAVLIVTAVIRAGESFGHTASPGWGRKSAESR
jgi:hypothetical protein